MTTGSHTIRSGRPTIPRLPDLIAYDASGLGHIATALHATRHPCGEPVRAERFRWPATARCPECIGTVGITVDAPTETEQRALWGDR